MSSLVERPSPPTLVIEASSYDSHLPILRDIRHIYHESVMAPSEANVDYYAVLEIPNVATIDIVTKSYRRLAKVRHPDKNLSADSTAVFQLVRPVTF